MGDFGWDIHLINIPLQPSTFKRDKNKMKTTLSTLLLVELFLAGVLIPEPVVSQNNGVNRVNIVTYDFFYGIMAKSPNNCRGRSFYTRVAFLRAIRDYPEFARSGLLDRGGPSFHARSRNFLFFILKFYLYKGKT